MAPVTPEIPRRRRARALESVAFVAAFGMFVLFFWAAVASLILGISVQELALRAWTWINTSSEHRLIAALTPFSIYGLARVIEGLLTNSQRAPARRNDQP